MSWRSSINRPKAVEQTSSAPQDKAKSKSQKLTKDLVDSVNLVEVYIELVEPFIFEILERYQSDQDEK